MDEYSEAIADSYLIDEDRLVRQYTQMITPDVIERGEVTTLAVNLINKIRQHPDFNGGLDAFEGGTGFGHIGRLGRQ